MRLVVIVSPQLANSPMLPLASFLPVVTSSLSESDVATQHHALQVQLRMSCLAGKDVSKTNTKCDEN